MTPDFEVTVYSCGEKRITVEKYAEHDYWVKTNFGEISEELEVAAIKACTEDMPGFELETA